MCCRPIILYLLKCIIETIQVTEGGKRLAGSMLVALS